MTARRATPSNGFWVPELRGGMAGVCGIKPVPLEAEFNPATKIGWRIATRFQRRGIAEEAARLGLRRQGTFKHPHLPEGHWLGTHLLYAITRAEWSAGRLG
jgi:RimJ/RimL family protein N-acetyltransferase